MKSISKLLRRISSAVKPRQLRNRTDDSLQATYLRTISSSQQRFIAFSSHTPSSRSSIAPPNHGTPCFNRGSSRLFRCIWVYAVSGLLSIFQEMSKGMKARVSIMCWILIITSIWKLNKDQILWMLKLFWCGNDQLKWNTFLNFEICYILSKILICNLILGMWENNGSTWDCCTIGISAAFF